MNILALLQERFRQALNPLVADPQPYVEMVRTAQDPRFGDFQANCAMPLVKLFDGKSARDIAALIVSHLDVSDMCDPPEIAGPGFINLRLKDDWVLKQVNVLISDERMGVPRVKTPKHVVVDYSAPNVAKPMHVGHLRSSVIGDSLYRILKFCGHRVTGDNHIGDWGTQFGMIIYGYKHFRDEHAYALDPVGELARLYRLVNQLSDYHELTVKIPQLEQGIDEQLKKIHDTERQISQAPPADKSDKTGIAAEKEIQKSLQKLRTELSDQRKELTASEEKRDKVQNDPVLLAIAKKHPDIAVLSREETAKLHAGNDENKKLWEQFLPRCLEALQQVYDRLGIEFDLTLGESFYQPLLGDVVTDLVKSRIARESEGAICAFIEGNDAPFIIRKGDGAFTYATTDLATIRYRVEVLRSDVILYVVDARQSEHFKLLFETARTWGFKQVDFRHVSFGTILGEDRRPYKTRSGDTIGLESLIDESIARARKIVDDNDNSRERPELDDPTRATVADAVGIGGIKYADLKHNRDSDYVFNWEKMLAMTGDTATYIQYANARIGGILRKGNCDRLSLRKSGATIQFTESTERELVMQILRLASAVDDVLIDYRPHLLANYLFETADKFTRFYNDCPVLSDKIEESVRASRLLLCDLTGRVLELGLHLLGIQPCEKM
ncbi:MAG: arginine--tRNA ligase [Planctomycetota bacterium]|nr:arginine--tRNA ligase [Planctomycetota bacterium]